MNDRIDDLARRLAGPPTQGRREFLRRAAAIVGGGMATVLLGQVAVADDKPKSDNHDDRHCRQGTVLCGKTCRVLSRDPHNCGSCGRACSPGNVCRDGTCMEPPGRGSTTTTTTTAPTTTTTTSTTTTSTTTSTTIPTCIPSGQTISGTYPFGGGSDSNTCLNDLRSKCCSGVAAAGSSCNCIGNPDPDTCVGTVICM